MSDTCGRTMVHPAHKFMRARQMEQCAGVPVSGLGAEGPPPLSAYDREDPAAGPVLGDQTLLARQRVTDVLAGYRGMSRQKAWLISAEVIDAIAGPVAALVAAARCPSCRPVGGGYCQTCGKPL